MSHLRRAGATVVAGVLAAVLITGVADAAAKARTGPAGTAFYKAPAGSLSGTAHGGVIWARPQTGPDALKGAGPRTLLLYRTIGVAGKPVAVSGSVTLPKGKAPKGGWPVVTYAHGTTGIADKCAPTRNPGSGDIAGYTAYVYPTLRKWLAKGYAVVRTDYEGLGTAGDHPYLIGRSEGRAVMDAVRAARVVAPSLGKRVVIAGHSQGGHAALWAASIAGTWTPELRVRGTVAFAPASHLSEQAALIPALKSPGGGLSGLAASLLRGLDAARAGVDIPGLLSPAALALYPQTQTLCQAELGKPASFGGLAPADIVRSDFDPAALFATIDRVVDPENLKLRTPVLVLQGEGDTTVFPTFTRDLVDALRAGGSTRVQSRTFPGVDHGGIVSGAGEKAATAWIADRLK